MDTGPKLHRYTVKLLNPHKPYLGGRWSDVEAENMDAAVTAALNLIPECERWQWRDSYVHRLVPAMSASQQDQT